MGYGLIISCRSPEKHQSYGPMADAVWIETISSTKTGKDEGNLGRSHTKQESFHQFNQKWRSVGPKYIIPSLKIALVILENSGALRLEIFCGDSTTKILSI